MKTSLFFLATIALLGCNHPESKAYERLGKQATLSNNEDPNKESHSGYKVIGIKDGDTFVLLIDGKAQTVRLAHIDCPEKKQPFGNKAKQFSSDLCFGKFVELVHNNKYDRNKRLIAEILLVDGTNINKELVRNGLAWHFKKYSNDTEYAKLEIEARKNQIGIWSESNATAPWTWRKNRNQIQNSPGF
jgi:micrococcal nuclease